MSKYELYLNEIKRTISTIENSVKGYDYNKFSKDKNLIDASAMRIQVIGESAKKLPNDFKKDKKDIWKDFERMRNIISHAYIVFNKKIIWKVILEEIPELKKMINKKK
ncbi:DUF86 domain-containing protein [Candidatus Pacearchaeota archaeon]|nr:DUF86 domain-containing protein [Candidatus Pacearchaeota archaeon]